MLKQITLTRLMHSHGPQSTLLVRLAAGSVFLVSGIVKFLYANQGEGRFLKLGFAAPEATAHFVGTVEVAAGGLLIVGLLTRLAALSLAIDMLVALYVSKLPLLFGAGPEPVAAAPRMGFWAFAYVARLDVTMLLLTLFLLAVGAGGSSLDMRLFRRLTVIDRDPRGAAEPPLAA